MIPANDITQLQDAFRANPYDLGVGLYNPITGEIRLGSYDTVAGGQGHEGLASAVGITDKTAWRGFAVSSDGKFYPISHFNLPDGSLTMKPDHADFVRQELLQAGLIS